MQGVKQLSLRYSRLICSYELVFRFDLSGKCHAEEKEETQENRKAQVGNSFFPASYVT